MEQSKIELNIPSHIVDRARQIADDKSQSLEAVLVNSLALLFGDLPDTTISPEDLATYSDEQLWAIVHQRLIWVQDTRLRELVDKGKQENLSHTEQDELQHLLDLVDRYTLLRSEALVLLKQRGHDIDATLKLGA